MMGGTRKPTAAQSVQVVTVPKIRQSASPATAKKRKKKEQSERRNQPPEYRVPDENRSE